MSDLHTWRPTTLDAADLGLPPDLCGLTECLQSFDLATRLVESRALRFTGFNLTEDQLEAVTARLLDQRKPYVHGNSPRTKIGDNIYTSTEFPAEFVISMHNELSYARSWPSRLLFVCVQASETGGETPLVHGGLWREAIGEEICDAFADGVIYRQCLHGGMGLGKSWQATFETEDADEVEKFLAASEAEWEWTASGALKISQLRPAMIDHPVTGERVWFSQMDQWHPAALGEATMADLLALMPEDELPQSVAFADGRPIPDQFALRVRQAGLDSAVADQWHAGDALLIDNVAVGHGRHAYTGRRRILVAMS